MRLLPLSTALLILAHTPSAHAASFDCGNAKSMLEKTICGDAQLNQADTELGTAFRNAKKALPAEQWPAMLHAHKAWLEARRVRCLETDAPCLLGLYHSWTATLNFRAAPEYATSPAGAVSGAYTVGEVMSLNVHALSADEISIEISGAEPTAGRWICNYDGRATIQGNVAEIQETEAEETLRLEFSPGQVEVEEKAKGVSYYCGMGGTLGGIYHKKQ